MSTTTTLATLFSIGLNRDWSFSFIFHPALIVVAALTAAAIWWWNRTQLPDFEIDEAEIGVGPHKLKFRPNRRDQEIAYKIWVELSTRKIGLKIDLKNDVIAEVYDSWYSFFAITRELIKDIPISKVKDDSTRRIITMSVSLLNEGLRPHLTSWQARFRHWYDRQLAKAGDDVDPQVLQERFPAYADLSKDLLAVNERLIRYREKMRELVMGPNTMPISSSTETPAL